jgi:two-component system, probable response regulator PhcQ
MTMHRIMLVDDEKNILSALRRVFAVPLTEGGENLVVETFFCPLDALKRAKEGVVFSAVISDYRMPEMDGVAR